MYICIAAVVIFGVKFCTDGKGLSDPAAVALSQACASIGMAPSIELRHDAIIAECKNVKDVK